MTVPMNNFLRKPAGIHKRPPLLFVGDYRGVIKNREHGAERNEKKTPYLQLILGFTAWPENCPEEWDQFDHIKNVTERVKRSDIDLSQRQLRAKYYTTDEALWVLDELLVSLGINNEEEQKPYDEIIPLIIGAPVMIEVQKYIGQRDGREGNAVGRVVGIR